MASRELRATATLASRYTPHETSRSEKRNGSRGDKSLVLKDAPQPNEGRVGWQDIVLAFEFKLGDKDNDIYDSSQDCGIIIFFVTILADSLHLGFPSKIPVAGFGISRHGLPGHQLHTVLTTNHMSNFLAFAPRLRPHGSTPRQFRKL
ncbi:hypothetical protein PTI98_008722 [Pleurotus ostreatus]|nr:hypothetical protein PTI98_008722 [Pleurotus ostreatus]